MTDTTSLNRIITHPQKTFDKQAAEFIFKDLQGKGINVLALPTGKTPLGMYKQLVKLTKTQNFSWQKIKIFMLDALYSQDSNDSQSYLSYIKRQLLDHIDIPKENFHILDSQTKNPEVECQKYEKEIKYAGGLDLAILGIGKNGHIGFNEPGTLSDTTTHLVKLTPDTLITATARRKKTSMYGMTMGIKTILSSKKILLLAKGKQKAKAVYNAVKGPTTSSCPASYLQTHSDTLFILDEEAAKLL